MKNDSDPNEYTSRRTFTKSIATTLISTPIIASAISCRPSSNTNQNSPTPSSPTPTPTPSPTTSVPGLVRVDVCVKPPPTGGEDHIPPLLLGEGGSFKVESAHELTDQPEPINPPKGNRKWRYKTTGTMEKYGNIEKIQVIIESKKYLDSRSTYVLTDEKNGLKMWLQPWDNSTGSWKQPPPSETSEPDILLQGKSGGSSYDSLFLEVDDKFSKKIKDRHNKKDRPHKQVREFGPKDDDMRIYRWAIVDKNDAVIQRGTVDDETPPYEGFQFMVTFHD